MPESTTQSDTTPTTSIKSLGIIGYGDFGQFLHEMAGKTGPHIEVKVSSYKREVDNKTFFSLEDVCMCDLVVIAVPVHAFKEVLESVIPLLGKDSIIVDVATVKKHTCDLLAEHRDEIRYVATHPMFGPYSYEKRGDSLEGLRLVISDSELGEGQYAALYGWITSLGLVILELKPEEHDRMLAETLFLTHFLSQVVYRGGFKRTEIDTLSFGFLMDAIDSVKNDTELFKDVYKYNPYCREVLERMHTTCEKVGYELEEHAKK